MRCLCLVLIAGVLGRVAAARAFADPAEKPAPVTAAGAAAKTLPDPEAVARRLWAVTELVREKCVAPPTRADMLLRAARTFARVAGRPLPADWPERVAKAASAGELGSLLREVWPQAGGRPEKATADPQAALLEGLLEQVPGNAQFISAEEFKVIEQVNANRYVGTGIQIVMSLMEDLPTIISPFPGGPARKAGARPGDLIVQVDGVSLKGVGIRKTVDLLRGDEGTVVTMVVRQPGSTKTRTLKLVRSVVPFTTVTGYRRVSEDTWDFHAAPASPVAYVRIDAIKVSTLHELRKIEPVLQAAGFRALVLDLRFAQGERLHDAALLADGLLDGGVMWRVRSAGGKLQEFRADRDCLFRGWPLAVLVDDRTIGSGPEMLAAALQDSGRATLVGQPMRGDHYERAFVSLPDGQGVVRMATGVAERAAGPSGPAGWRVRPNQEAALEPKQQESWLEWRRQQEINPAPANAKAPDDPPLGIALALLRAALDAPPNAKSE